MAARNGSAEWRGDLGSGSGTMTVGEGAWTGSFTAGSRFGEEDHPETNPEQLIAAAHAGCFSMAFANTLAGAGHTPESVRTTAQIELRNIDGAPTLARVDLVAEANVPGIDADEFQRLAEEAKNGCPVSRALGAIPEIALTAKLV